jgi:2-iminobutanoate/2-iminopropanoate deaminase
LKQKQVHHARPALERSFNFAQAIRIGDTVYVSGCLSWDEDGNVLAKGDMAGQIRNVYEELRRSLAAFGLGMEHIVKETAYTTDMEALAANAIVRDPFYPPGGGPTATWVEIKRLVNPDLLLEVEAIAVIP